MESVLYVLLKSIDEEFKALTILEFIFISIECLSKIKISLSLIASVIRNLNLSSFNVYPKKIDKFDLHKLIINCLSWSTLDN